jgi:hypothetical protein
VHIGDFEAGSALVPWLGEGGMGGLAEESHRIGTESPNANEAYRVERA